MSTSVPATFKLSGKRSPEFRVPPRRFLWPFGLGLLLIAAFPVQGEEVAKPLNRSISPSRQFVVYADNSRIRLRLTSQADDAATLWRDWTGYPKEWKTPIILNLADGSKGRVRPAIRTSLSEADGGASKIQIEVLDPSQVSASDLAAEIFRALALEVSYRDRPPKSGKSYRLAPDWLVEGLAEEMRSRQDGVPARVIEGLLNAPQKPSVMDLLRGRPPTIPLERDLYRMLSMAFTRTLSQLPEGRRGIRQLISLLPETELTPDQILKTFPSLQFDLGNLGKEWTLTLAKIASGSRMDLLGFEATGGEVMQIFTIRSPKDPKNPEVAPLTGTQALSEIARSPGGAQTLQEISTRLLQLETRAHPIYQPLIVEYRALVGQLLRKPKSNIRKRLQKNDELFLLITSRSKEIRDYLNWFEVNKQQAPDTDFLEAVRAEPLLPLAEDQPRSAISTVLDTFEQTGW